MIFIGQPGFRNGFHHIADVSNICILAAAISTVGCNDYVNKPKSIACKTTVQSLGSNRPTVVFAENTGQQSSDSKKRAIIQFLTETESGIANANVSVKEIDINCYLVLVVSEIPTYVAVYVIEDFDTNATVYRFVERIE